MHEDLKDSFIGIEEAMKQEINAIEGRLMIHTETC